MSPPSSRALTRSRRSLTSGVGGWLRRAKRWRRAAAASKRYARRPRWRAARSVADWSSFAAARTISAGGSAGPGAAARQRLTGKPDCSKRLPSLSSRPFAAIRKRRCCGSAGASGISPARWPSAALRPAISWSAGCCGVSVSSLQANRKTREGTSHPDRDAQFEHINAQVSGFQSAGQPAISVDTKKKELVGDFKNGGRELCPKGEPEPVRVHDFRSPHWARACPAKAGGTLWRL